MPALSLVTPSPWNSAELDLVCPSCGTSKRLNSEDFEWILRGSIGEVPSNLRLHGQSTSPSRRSLLPDFRRAGFLVF
jgi:hypothetical protein